MDLSLKVAILGAVAAVVGSFSLKTWAGNTYYDALRRERGHLTSFEWIGVILFVVGAIVAIGGFVWWLIRT